jgi:integrase
LRDDLMSTPPQIDLQREPEANTLRRSVIEPASKGGSLARKRYQRGTVVLRGSSWFGRYRESLIGPDGGEIRIQRGTLLGSKKDLPTKRLAERRLEVILAPINSLSYRPGRVATVAEFAERWKTEVLSKRKPSTIHAAKSHLNNQIIPILGRMRLNEVGVENQQIFVTRVAGTVSRKMLLNILGTLSSMLRTADNWGYTCEGINFRKLVLPEKTVTKKAMFFTADQVRLIISEAKGQYRVMFAIAAMTGLRVGEILALQVGDFDFDQNLLAVRRSVWRGNVSAPKTSTSQAVLPLPSVLGKIVREHIETVKSEWLFLNARGNLFIAENVVRQALTPILTKLKLPLCGFHAFRHTHATLLLYNGATPQETQAQLRHADPRMTIGVYSHVQVESRRGLVDRLASILCPNVPNLVDMSKIIQ